MRTLLRYVLLRYVGAFVLISLAYYLIGLVMNYFWSSERGSETEELAKSALFALIYIGFYAIFTKVKSIKKG